MTMLLALLVVSRHALAVPEKTAVREALAAMRKAEPECTIGPGPSALEYDIACPGKDKVVFYADRLVSLCAEGRVQCDDARERIVRTMVKDPHDDAVKLVNVVPELRPHAYLQAAPDPTLYVSAHLTGGIDLIYMFDSPDALFPVQISEMATLGVDQAGLEAAAKDNCARIFRVLDRVDVPPMHFLAGGDYAACVLIAPQLAVGIDEGTPTTLIFPDAKSILIATDASARVTATLVDAATKGAAAAPPTDYPFPPTPFTMTPTGWQVLP